MPNRVYDVLAKAFIQEGVSTCFTLMGDANMNWAARLAQQGCRMVYVRHEHCAVAAAMAYARKTSDVGVATVTCGPGVTQLITALPAAVRAHLPLVVFAGEAPLKSSWYNQGIDQAPIIKATGADYHPPAPARAHADRDSRCVPAGAPRTAPGGDRHSVRSAGAALGRTGEASRRLRRELLPRLSPMPPHPDDVAQRRETGCGRRARRRVCRPGRGRSQGGARVPGAGRQDRWTADHDAACKGTLPRRSLLHRHHGQLLDRGRARVSGAGRPRHRGRRLARLPRRRRRSALAEGEDAAHRHRSPGDASGPGSGASPPARRRTTGRGGADGGIARAQQDVAHRGDGRAHPRFETRQPCVRDRAGAARPARCGRSARESAARRLGARELLGPLLVVLRADAFAPAGEVPHDPRVRRDRQRHLLRHGRRGRAPGQARWCCSTATAA